MGASQRRKGAVAERELASLLSLELGWNIKRKLGQARDSGDDMDVGPFRIESKRRKGIAVYPWLEQVQACSGPGQIPVVMARADGKGWIVILALEDFLPLMRGELGDSR